VQDEAAPTIGAGTLDASLRQGSADAAAVPGRIHGQHPHPHLAVVQLL
jgi:hypothetical protein